MDSDEDGEATSAFLQARRLLRKQGPSGFRRILEEAEQAAQINEELAGQNRRLHEENTMLHARHRTSQSRTAKPFSIENDFPIDVGMSTVIPRRWLDHQWGIGVILLMLMFGYFGFLNALIILTAASVVFLIVSPLRSFNPLGFLSAVVVGLLAIGIIVFNRSTEDPPTTSISSESSVIATATAAQPTTSL